MKQRLPIPRRCITLAHMMKAVCASALTFWVGSWWLTPEDRRDPAGRLFVQVIPAIVVGFRTCLDAPEPDSRPEPSTRRSSR